MSKELAQTVGGKKIAALFAIIAALAVFATVANTWQSAKADVDGAEYWLDESDAGVSDTADAGTTTPVTAGTVQNYEFSICSDVVATSPCVTGLAAPTAGDLQVVIKIATGNTINSATAGGGPSPLCTGTGTDTVTCTYSGPVAIGTIANLILAVAINNDVAAAPATFTVQDLGSAQAAQPGTEQIGAIDALAAGALTKAPASSNVTSAGGTVTHTITFTNGGDALAAGAGNLVITDAIPVGVTVTAIAFGGTGTHGFPANCGATLPLAGAATITCTSGGATVASGQTVTVDITQTVSASAVARTLTDTAGGTATYPAPLGVATLNSPTAVINQSALAPTAELRHWSGSAILTAQEVPNDVRGHRHTVCTVQINTGIPNVAAVATTIPLTSLSQINVEAGGGATATTDPDPTFEDVQIFIGNGTNGLNGATCFSWVSTEAGDQDITVIYTDAATGAPVTISWDSDANGNGLTPVQSNRSLVKEWNVLEESCITLSGAAGSGCSSAATASAPTVETTVGALFNPANSTYAISPITITDAFWGYHVNRTGGWEDHKLWGVDWEAWLTTACGTLDNLNPTAAAPLTGTTGPTGEITLTVAADASCLHNDKIVVAITGTEPGVLGSGTQVSVTQYVVINLSSVIQTKQVFLAWAGQRVIVEHDWRLPPGDVDGGASDSVAPVTGSTCPFYALDGSTPYAVDFRVRYVRQAGSDGNFIAGLGAVLSGNDEATVIVDNDNSQTDGDDIIGDANGSCISRVLYESENEGQVNIEAFVLDVGSVGQDGWQPVSLPDPLNQTKIAFVIYYMKLESVTVSLVDDVAKPYHNVSNTDWSPGNPWDATKDVSTVDWNVSKDLLVRARVKGWFTTQNQTGRAAGTDTNGGVLPAGRWVMPDDWALLAGGPADPADGSDAIGIAEAYQPQKDIMIAPNNSSGRSLSNPEGTAAEVHLTSLASSASSTATTIYVASKSGIVAGVSCLKIDNEYMLVTAIGATTNPGGTALTVTRASSCGGVTGGTNVAASHAAAAVVTVVTATGVPFEGPYSLLDLPGLAVTGMGGAALSNYDPNNIRDTIWGDGDVDMWDAPMPPSLLTLSIRGAGWIKQVLKQDVYYVGTANASGQVYPNPFYIVNIPDSPFIPAVVAGGGYLWDSWGNDGPGCTPNAPLDCVGATNGDGVYRFWRPAGIGSNIWGVGDSSVTTTQAAELAAIRTAYGDSTIARDLVVYTDNHGEAMVAANGDFKLDYSGCASNALAGGKHCAPGDKAGASTITAVADYPDFRGKHYPLLSNVATVNWTWGGYKDVTIEDGETEQYKYVVFHAMDRDGFCYSLTGGVLLHPVLSGAANDTWWYSDGTTTVTNPPETVDFMIDSGEGIILTTNAGASSSSTYSKQFAEGVPTFSTYANDPATSGVKEFPLSALAATGATDECQAWIKVSNSLLGILDILVIAHDDEGDVGFDKIIDLQSTMSYSLSFRWTLITWAGADGIATADALKGSGGSTNDITSSVTAVYGWDAAAQAWLGYFPSAVPVPGANDLTKLNEGDAYWIAITGPGSVTWTIATNVD
ncbi:MAG: hypothetical protein KJ053_13550 [Dehalococcoidia bacterium]|nr:hypothetical protein [Dehalococcoidia bacterium]